MRRIKGNCVRARRPGFTLPAVLLVVGALLILAVGALLVAGIERGTARSFVDRQRAELAVLAGIGEVREIMRLEMANDDFLVVGSQWEEASASGREAASQLFVARGRARGDGIAYRYVPMFGALDVPADDGPLRVPELEPLLGGGGEHAEFATLPWRDRGRSAWLPVRDEKGRVVARYAYWVEDLQGCLDPLLTGNVDGDGGDHVRVGWPFPAAGVNPEPEGPVLNQVALYAVDPEAAENEQGNLARVLAKNRNLMVSPDSLLAAAGVEPPLERGDDGRLADPAARAAEENLATGIRPYFEQALVPFAEGIDPGVAGGPKLNLNRLLETGGEAAVTEMAGFIDRALPAFEGRKGGFSDDYLKTLAANALDYADADSEATVGVAGYRGLDGYPLVSEFLMRFRWNDVVTEGGMKYVLLEVSTYVELWNLTSIAVSGDARVTYETEYRFQLGANPEVVLSDLSLVDGPRSAVLEEAGGYRWFPEFGVTLKPDEYRVYHCGTVRYRILAGPSSIWIASPLSLGGETHGRSGAGYRLKWNGRIVDGSRGGVHRNDSTLHYPKNTKRQPRQKVRATIPSHSHTRYGEYRNNMGDPRMSCYNLAPQDANTYPMNYSPNRRNIRWGSVYSGDAAAKPKVHGRVMPSEWPDGGHNSEYGAEAFQTTDQRVLPDDPRFFPAPDSVLRNPPVEKAPMRLSNAGRYFSATELGRVYDPLMWSAGLPPGANLPWGDVTPSSVADGDFGGGNTLRIGRPEHPRFQTPGMEAYRLLDLFHAGRTRSADVTKRCGNLVRIEGAVNLNTASRACLRALAYGARRMDPLMSRRVSESHDLQCLMAPPVEPLEPGRDDLGRQAERIADAIVETRKTRPFASVAEASEARTAAGRLVFGNKDLLAGGELVHRTDSAAEEVFGRVYEASTVRSRNFRVWVVGQALAKGPGMNGRPDVRAEVRKVFTVFADPGERDADGSIDGTKFKPRILHENRF